MKIVTNSDILGKNIQYLRRKHWMTRKKLAGLVQWDTDDVKAMEKDQLRDIEKDTLLLICRLFDVDVMTLMTVEFKKKN